MPLVLLLVFIGLPIAEIYVIIQVGEAIGVIPTVLLLLLDGFLGTWIFRREGRKAWQALQQAINERRIPTREVTDGALVVVGGALLLAPGFITDVVGLFCVLPPTRALLRVALSGYVGRRLVVAPSGGLFGGSRRSRQDDVVDGEVVRDSEDPEPPKLG